MQATCRGRVPGLQSFAGLVFIIDQLDKFTNGSMRFQLMSQPLVPVDRITISPARFFNTDDTGLDQFCQDSLHCTLSNPDLERHLPDCRLWFVRQANKYVRVIAEKSPATVDAITFVHNVPDDINIATLVTGQ